VRIAVAGLLASRCTPFVYRSTIAGWKVPVAGALSLPSMIVTPGKGVVDALRRDDFRVRRSWDQHREDERGVEMVRPRAALILAHHASRRHTLGGSLRATRGAHEDLTLHV
jgi:hypothetical protein